MNAQSPLLFKATDVARAARDLGGRALLVGGFVRDELLGENPKDADLEVYGLEAPVLRSMLEKLGRVDCVGESFRVYKLVWHAQKVRYELDVSLPRRDTKVGDGHKGFEVEGDPFASFEDAARRRDFTVNAILKDPLTDEIIDPFGGKTDLDAKILRAVDANHFGEDSLRVLRAMQFAARFDLSIEPKTVEICRATRLDDLPHERIWGEWEKWLLKSNTPAKGLVAGAEIGVFERLFPYLQIAFERRGDEIGRTLDGAAAQIGDLDYPEKVALMLAALGTFLGWRDTRKMLEGLGIQKLKGKTQAVDVALMTIKLVGARKTPRDWFAKREWIADKDFRFFSARVRPDLTVRLAKARGFSNAAEWFESNCERLGVLNGPPEKILLGRHLMEMGVKPGPHMGEVLERVYFLQLSGEVTNLDEAIAAARKILGI